MKSTLSGKEFLRCSYNCFWILHTIIWKLYKLAKSRKPNVKFSLEIPISAVRFCVCNMLNMVCGSGDWGTEIIRIGTPAVWREELHAVHDAARCGDGPTVGAW